MANKKQQRNLLFWTASGVYPFNLKELKPHGQGVVASSCVNHCLGITLSFDVMWSNYVWIKE